MIDAAFPSVCLGDPGHPASSPGMSLRDWFAGQALAFLPQVSLDTLASGHGPSVTKSAAEMAYYMADAMLAARNAVAAVQQSSMQHVAYYDEGAFHWMSGIRPRDCELYAAPVGAVAP